MHSIQLAAMDADADRSLGPAWVGSRLRYVFSTVGKTAGEGK